MDSVVPENIRRILTHYTFETDADSISEELTCIICSKLMIDAYQTGCGCKYCRECVVGYLCEGNNYCRGGKEECKEDQLVLDNNVCRSSALNKRIMKVRVHCPNIPCVFISQLVAIDDHLRVCGQQPMECPYTTIGCGSEGASKNTMETHLSNETLTHSRLLMEAINNLRNELGGIREGLRLSQLEVAFVKEELRMNETARRGVLEHVEEERRLRREEKEHLLEQMKTQRKEQLEQIEENKRVLMDVLEAQASEIKELRMKVECGEEEVHKGLSRTAMLEVAVATMRREIDLDTEKRKTVEAEVATVKAAAVEFCEDNRRRVEAMRAETTQMVVEGEKRVATSVREERKRVDELARTMGTLNAGTNMVVAVGRLCFTVDRWVARMGRGGEAVWSQYVYSHANGYKLRVRVHPGGDDRGAGTHMSVYSVLCRGEYDAVLPWPCTHRMTVSVVNQRTNEAHRTGTRSCCTINKDAFSRPIDRDNPPRGWPTFVSHADLQSIDGLVVNDSVLLVVVVAPPPADVVAFTVDRFRARRAAKEIVCSPCFYSHTNGYKLHLRVYPWGSGGGRGTHVSVFLVVCKGENDGTLVWPCRYGVAISLVNQRTNEAHETRTLTPFTTCQISFHKPIVKDILPWGWDIFVPHADLDSTDGLVVNDSVLLHVALIPPQ